MKALKEFIKPQKPWEVEGVEWREVRLGDVVRKTEKINLKTKSFS